MSPAKVITIKTFGKIRRFGLCSGVAAYCVKSMLCVVQDETHPALKVKQSRYRPGVAQRVPGS